MKAIRPYRKVPKLLLPIFYTLLLLLTFSSDIHGQSRVVTGTVTDIVTGEVLIGATIASGPSAGTITDLSGTFELVLPTSEVELLVSYLGYRDLVVQLNELDNTKSLDLGLEKSQMILETTTITGSRYEKSLSRSAVSINVIQPQLLDNTNTTNIDKLLDKIPGVQMIDGQANIRGGSGYSYGAGSRVLLLIDDVPAFQADAGRPLWDDIPVENIAQVEVLKGASSAMYGSAALNGVVNIRTGYATSDPVTKAAVAYTHYGNPKDLEKKWWDSPPSKYNLSLLHKRKVGKLDVVANGFYENFSSYYKDAFKEKYRLSANIKYRFSDKISLTLNTMYNYKDDLSHLLWSNARNEAYQGWEGTSTVGTTKRFYLDPQLTIYDGKSNKHKFLSRYYCINNGNENGQATNSDNWFIEYQYTSKLPLWEVDLTAGLSSYFTNSNSELFGQVDLSSTNLAAFVQLEKDFTESLTLAVGSRVESNIQSSPEVFLGDTIPDGRVSETRVVSRVGSNYKIAEGTFIRGSWGMGYRYPSLAERFIITDLGGFFILPNPQLQSETGWTTELGVKQILAIGDFQGFIDLSFFRSQYNDMMEFTFGEFNGQSGFQSQNVGNTVINGFEINLIGQFGLAGLPLNVLAGYTFIDPRYRDFEDNVAIRQSITRPITSASDANFLKYRNRHNAKMDIESARDGLNIGLAINYSSVMITMDQFLSNLNEIEFYRAANPNGYMKLDARCSVPWRGIKISLLAENLLNSEYAVRPGVLEAPRNYSMRLDMKF